jgi:hypothetical protein
MNNWLELGFLKPQLHYFNTANYIMRYYRNSVYYWHLSLVLKMSQHQQVCFEILFPLFESWNQAASLKFVMILPSSAKAGGLVKGVDLALNFETASNWPLGQPAAPE